LNSSQQCASEILSQIPFLQSLPNVTGKAQYHLQNPPVSFLPCARLFTANSQNAWFSWANLLVICLTAE
jgi:hypothetical protein